MSFDELLLLHSVDYCVDVVCLTVYVALKRL